MYLYCFDVYISDDVKTDLATYGLRNIQLITCIRSDQWRIQDHFKHLKL